MYCLMEYTTHYSILFTLYAFNIHLGLWLYTIQKLSVFYQYILKEQGSLVYFRNIAQHIS